jgi:nitroreductase
MYSAIEVIQQRRTLRRFTTADISDDDIQRLLTAAMAAPSLMGRKPWHFVVIRDAEVKKRIAEAFRVHPQLAEAPVWIAFLADVSASPAWRMDLSAAVMNTLLQATAMGLGATWIGTVDSKWTPGQVEACRTLYIPEGWELFAFVAVGKPAEQRPPHVLDPYVFSTRVHEGKWGNRRQVPSPQYHSEGGKQ